MKWFSLLCDPKRAAWASNAWRAPPHKFLTVDAIFQSSLTESARRLTSATAYKGLTDGLLMVLRCYMTRCYLAFSSPTALLRPSIHPSRIFLALRCNCSGVYAGQKRLVSTDLGRCCYSCCLATPLRPRRPHLDSDGKHVHNKNYLAVFFWKINALFSPLLGQQ